MEKTTKRALAFDLGASSGRAVLGTLENGKISMEEVHRFPNDPVTPETPEEVIRCINQSLALRYRHVLEQIQFCLDKNYHRIHMIGGGIQSRMLCRMTASAAHCEVAAGPVEATALGNLMVQFISLGLVSDLKEARAIIARSEQMTIYQPEDPEAWEKAYEEFKKCLP